MWRIFGRRRGASPHTRGWTVPRAPAAGAGAGFPAHAGMDPAGRNCCIGRRRLPRTRGDGPEAKSPRLGVPSASPHTRGWTPGSDRPAERGEGFPAHAGMDPTRKARPEIPTRLPRTRGDGPPPLFTPFAPDEASPHTRGWTRAAGNGARRSAGFPAHAGMDPGTARSRPRRTRLPRTRGDGPYACGSGAALQRASPHTRGWTPPVDPAPPRRVGFPAHAGMDPPRAPESPGAPRLPRTRGDGPSSGQALRRSYGASPHTRGWTPSCGVRCRP